MSRQEKPDYISIRISQLIDEAHKTKDEQDKQWFMRICQELQWAKEYDQGMTKPGCFLQNGI